MSIELVPFARQHIPAAAEMVATRCRALCERVPVFPPRYTEPETLAAMLANHPPGATALRGGRLVGFLVAYAGGEFRGKGSVYCPEWGHAAEEGGASRIYQAMYTHLAREWMSRGLVVHTISAPAHDRPCIETWHWLGFGFVGGDALRSLESVPGPAKLDVRRAGPSDAGVVAELVLALTDHLHDSPTFLAYDAGPDLRLTYEGLLADPSVAIWLAEKEREAVGYLKLVPSDQADSSPMVRDPGTISITGAYVRPDVRGRGVASRLLDRGIAWARECGYVRCAVDFETMNGPAARFWTRHFALVSLSLMRYSDERLAGQNAP